MGGLAQSPWRRALVQAFRLRLEPHDDPRPLALLRISLGLITLAHVAALWPLAEFLFTDEGLLPAAEICGTTRGRLSLLCHLPSSAVPTYFAAFGVVTLAFTLGVATRVTAILTTIGFSAFVLRNPVYAAGDQVFWSFLFLLCLSRCGEAWSVDAWWRSRRQPRSSVRRIPGWPRVLMIVQLCVLYGANGWNKHGPDWIEGDALAYMLMNDRWFRFPPWGLVTYAEPLLRLATWIVWWFERLFPLVGVAAAVRAVLEVRDAGGTATSRRGGVLRWLVARPFGVMPWLGLTVLFHGSLIVLLNLGWFVPATLAAGLCLLPRLPWTSRWPESSAAGGVTTTRARIVRGLTVSLIVWHSLAMVQGSLPVLVNASPELLDRSLKTWRRYTNTRQPWWMFSSGVPKRSLHLQAVGIRANGTQVPIPSLLDWHLDRTLPYIGHERRRKVAVRILKAPRWRQRYERWLCGNARDASGQPFSSIAIDRLTLQLPPPTWMAEHGPIDPYKRFADRRKTRRLSERPCSYTTSTAAETEP